MTRWTAICTLVLAMLVAGRARADGPFEGQWREGAMTINVTVESWGGDCGPRPQSTSSSGGGVFRISQSGDQLTFHLRSQRTTRSCWSENRAVRRVSSTFQAGTWRVVCRTPASDSRAETGTYTIQSVGEDRLTFRDQSRYDWQLNESSCQATITTTQSFTRVGGGPSATPEPTPTPAEPATPRCTPGAPTRLVLRPSSAEVAPGGEQCFTTRVLDANGCAVRRAVALSVAEGGGAIRGQCYRAPAEEGTARILASAGRLSDRARVSIHTMDLSDLIARRTETGSVGSGAPEVEVSSQTAARVSANATAEAPSLLWPALGLGAALFLVVAAVVMLRRRGAPAPSKPRGRQPEVARAREAVAPLAARDEPAPSAPPSTPPEREDVICPSCRRGYPPTTERCPHDDSALMPYKDFVAGKGSGGEKKNVCPTCGEEYPTTVTFCGKDGSTLQTSTG